MSDTSIVANAVSNDLVGFGNTDISVKWLESYNAITTGEIPKHAIKKHTGKAGKTFTYIDHVWVTQQLRRYFKQTWSFEVLDYSVHPDGTATARGKLYFKVPKEDGTFVYRDPIIEVGAFEGPNSMSNANKIASAVSRSLVRCAFRMFGWGEQFYIGEGVEEETTPLRAANSLLNFIDKNKGSREEFIAFMKQSDISSDDLVDEEVFALAWKLAYEYIETKKAANLGTVDFLKKLDSQDQKPQKQASAPKQAQKPEPTLAQADPEPESEMPFAQNDDNYPPIPDIPDEDGPRDLTEEEAVAMGIIKPAAPKEPVAPKIDPNWRPTQKGKPGWAEILGKLKSAGFDPKEDVQPVMRKKYGEGNFDPEKLEEYWLHLVGEFNKR